LVTIRERALGRKKSARTAWHKSYLSRKEEALPRVRGGKGGLRAREKKGEGRLQGKTLREEEKSNSSSRTVQYKSWEAQSGRATKKLDSKVRKRKKAKQKVVRREERRSLCSLEILR